MQSNLYIVVIERNIVVCPTCVSMFSARNYKSLPELVLHAYLRPCVSATRHDGKSPVSWGNRDGNIDRDDICSGCITGHSTVVLLCQFCFALGRCRHENNC